MDFLIWLVSPPQPSLQRQALRVPTQSLVGMSRPPRRVAPIPRVLPGPEKLPANASQGPGDSASAVSWRAYAEACLKRKEFQEASRAFSREAAIYRKSGDLDAATVEELKAARYRTEVELYCWQPARGAERPLARLEPESGCMVGAFIDRDEGLGSLTFSPQIHGDIAQFNQKVGRQHASFFTYLGFQREFPAEWSHYVRKHGAIPQLAWEPQSLSQVTPEKLDFFVAALQRYGGPVMLRFASEMNGAWTAYHRDPAQYRQTFRRVHQALRRAPQAALLWCPNALPMDNIAAYYPGDDGCDWVGVNFYSVMFLDNDPRRPGDWIHPIDLLQRVYTRYSHSKPIAIGEYAASHQSSVHPTPRIDFARIKMAQLYQGLPLRFPGVRLINWYDCNNLTQARKERQLNNFRLTDVAEILDDYSGWVQDPWFLGAGQSAAPLQALPFPKVIPGPLEIEPWVRSYEPNPQVFLRLDGRLIGLHQLPQGGRTRLGELRPGKHRLEVLVFDTSGRFVTRKAYLFEAL